MEDEREEGEIVDLNDDDIYENIISSDEVDEDDLRARIEELEAKNSELEKIASISKTYDYGGASNFINLADDDGDDDDSYYRQPSKYDYSDYGSSRKSSRRRRKACKHECKKSKRYKPYKTERRKKTQPNKTKDSSDSSSDDEFQLDRNELQAALKRNTSSIHSSTLKRKLIGVSKTVKDFIKAKEDVGDEDISTSIEIMHLLNKINIEEIAPQNKASISEGDTESCLNEQELRIIALKSAILKKAEARKKRKIIETQPYSPTDSDIVMENVIATKTSVNGKSNELDNMEISPAASPTIEDGSLQPIDMELESEDESQRSPMTNNQEEERPLLPLSKHVDIANVASKDLQNPVIVPVPDEMSLSTANVPEETNQMKSSLASSQHRKHHEEEEEEVLAMRASLLAALNSKKTTSNNSEPMQKLTPERTLSDASMEMEQLRKQVFSSIQKRRNLHRNLLPNPFAQKFSGQAPKPMEMTMPQITSNLKEALKRIKERDKQNVEADAASKDHVIKVDIAKVNQNVNERDKQNVKTDAASKDHGTKVDLAQNMNSVSETPIAKLNQSMNSVSQTPIAKLAKLNQNVNERDKLNVKTDAASKDHGTKVDLTQNMNSVTEIPRSKVNQNVNNVSETPKVPVTPNRSKKVHPDANEVKNSAVKFNGEIVSLKPTTNDHILTVTKSFELPNVVLKNVTCNNSSVETKTKDTTVALVISNKIETSLEKHDAIVRSLKAVAQKKAIAEPHISLNQKENQQLRKVCVSPKRSSEDKLAAAAKKTKIINAKVSRVITTPVEKPVKKMIIQLNNSDTESDDLGLGQNVESIANLKSYSGVASPASHSFSPSSPANMIDSKSSDAIPTTNDSFQRKLDEYLKSARTKVEQTKQETKTVTKSPSLVSHLPPSSQLEYRKLLNRMALLEKQKLLKMGKLKINKPKVIPTSSISVTIPNELFNQQPKSDEPIVQLNGVDANSSNDKETEKIVTVQSVDSDVAKESSKISCTSADAVVADSGVKINPTSVSDKCIQPKEATSINTETPEKSTNNVQNVSALLDDDKNKLLQQTESEYMNHSKLYLVDLNNMSLLVNKARQEKEKQFQIESEIEELELKVQQLKEQLIQQKIGVQKLYPIIASSHKDIMQKRTKSLQLNKKCYVVGSKIIGADYKIADDPKTDIAQKMKSLSSETKLLRNMKKPVASEKTTSVTTNDTVENSSRTESVDHTPTATSAAISISSAKPVEQQQSSENCTLDIPKPSSMVTYISPLDHMKNIGSTNPNSVVCPFQLTGQCEDKECTYQHLS